MAEIRQLEGGGSTSCLIIGVTGNVLQEDVNHFMTCGANKVLGKPVKFSKVEEIWKEHGMI